MSTKLASWIADHGVSEVECIVPDMNGVQRGKVLPAGKFLSSVKDGTLRIPGSVFCVTINGEYPDDIGHIIPEYDPDQVMVPDADTIREAPGFATPTAYVIADAFTKDGAPVDIAPRMILKKVLKLYEDRGWQPVIAPEVEFYLVSQNTDPDFPLMPPTGRSGRPETASQPYGLEALNEFEDIIEHTYDWCEKAGINIDTMIHESGAAQLEVNFLHGDPLRLADEVLLFKRLVRQVALQHGVNRDALLGQQAGDLGQHAGLVGHAQAQVEGAGDAALCAQRQQLSPDAARQRCADQRAMGHRQSLMRAARADFRHEEPPHRKPPAGGRQQPLSRHRRLAHLWLHRHDRPDAAAQEHHRQRL